MSTRRTRSYARLPVRRLQSCVVLMRKLLRPPSYVAATENIPVTADIRPTIPPVSKLVVYDEFSRYKCTSNSLQYRNKFAGLFETER